MEICFCIFFIFRDIYMGSYFKLLMILHFIDFPHNYGSENPLCLLHWYWVIFSGKFCHKQISSNLPPSVNYLCYTTTHHGVHSHRLSNSAPTLAMQRTIKLVTEFIILDGFFFISNFWTRVMIVYNSQHRPRIPGSVRDPPLGICLERMLDLYAYDPQFTQWRERERLRS